MILHLFRHGNAGIRQQAERFDGEPSAIYTAADSSCVETGEILQKVWKELTGSRAIPLFEMEEFTKFDMNDCDEKKIQQIQDGINYILKQKNQEAVLVTHLEVLRVIHGWFSNQSSEKSKGWTLPYGEHITIEFHEPVCITEHKEK